MNQLHMLAQMIDKYETRFIKSLATDLGKCPFEAIVTETAYLRAEIKYVRKRLKRWTAPRRIHTPLHSWPGRAQVTPQPLGVVLIIGPWNYPLTLCLSPLIGAIAAGNCVALKPSELAPHTSQAIADGLREYLDNKAVQVFEGGPDVAKELLVQRFDHIFFTGSQKIGRQVMLAASENMTPVTLELGGKNPCIVDADADLEIAARRIAWAKFINAGQTCVAPDYLLVHEAIRDSFLIKLKVAVQNFYGTDPQQSPDFARIVNNAHYHRLLPLLREGRIICGGISDATDLYIAPTVLCDISIDSPIMKEEIFGPILPVLSTINISKAVTFVNTLPTPLSVYLFSRSASTHRYVMQHTRSGGICVNDAVIQLAIAGLPFGGVGASGLGRYHGRDSIDTFSYKRSELVKTFLFDLPVRYPPYSERKLKWMRRFL